MAAEDAAAEALAALEVPPERDIVLSRAWRS